MASIYSDLLMKHTRAPYHFGSPSDSDMKLQQKNPLCGDEICLYFKKSAGKTFTVSWDGRCCAVCKTSASIMTQLIQNKSLDDMDECLQRSLDLKACPNQSDSEEWAAWGYFWGQLESFPVRHKCALFPWKVLSQLILNARGNLR